MEIDLYDYIYPDGVVDVRVGEYKAVISNDFANNSFIIIFTEPIPNLVAEKFEIPRVIDPSAVDIKGYKIVNIYPRVGTFIIDWNRLKKIK